jgi:hypothetical protein
MISTAFIGDPSARNFFNPTVSFQLLRIFGLYRPEKRPGDRRDLLKPKHLLVIPVKEIQDLVSSVVQINIFSLKKSIFILFGFSFTTLRPIKTKNRC